MKHAVIKRELFKEKRFFRRSFLNVLLSKYPKLKKIEDDNKILNDNELKALNDNEIRSYIVLIEMSINYTV